MQVSKWGNSLAIRIPATVVEALNLKEGEEVELRASQASDREFLLARPLTRAEAIEGLRQLRWKLPRGYKFNREELYERRRG